jgi:hypothetical protein
MRRLTAAVIVVVMMSGCSFIGVRGPSSRKLDCTDDFALPVFDTVIFAAATAAAVSVFYASATAKPCTGECIMGDLASGYAQVVGIPTALLAMLYGTSAASGYSTVAQCNSSKQEHQRRDEYLKLTPQERAARQREAETRRLHLEAVKEASAGNCAVVRGRDMQVRELNAEYHATVFLRDVAIKRCLDAPASAPVITPALQVTPAGPTQ